MLTFIRCKWLILSALSNLKPDWSIHDFERFPAVQWKLQNLNKLKISNSEKFNEFNAFLKEVLSEE